MAAIESIRVPGIDEPLKLGDWVHSALRSTINFSTGELAGDDIIFNYQVGGTVSGGGGGTATKRDTNMPDTGKLPQGMEALIYFVGIVYPADITQAAAQNIEINVTWELRINASKKVFDDGPASRFPAGGGIAGFSSLYGQGTTTERTQITNGFPGANAKQPYAIPHHLRELEPFDMNVNCAAALSIAANRSVGANLEGLVKRVVG